jgi:hypothetical protein
MEPSGSRAFPLREAYPFAEQNGLAAEAAQIRSLEIKWDRPYTSTVRRGYFIELFQREGFLDQFKSLHWPMGMGRKGDSESRRYLKIKAEFEAFRGGTSVPQPDEDEEDDRSATFALEAHLRDFLAANLERIEHGLRLYTTSESDGVEHLVDDGRIDLLAVDGADKFVVIELKLSRGRNKALGQLIYYMGWVDENLGNGPCRGMIVAGDIGPDLITAVQRVPGVRLYRYHLAFAIEEVTGDA